MRYAGALLAHSIAISGEPRSITKYHIVVTNATLDRTRIGTETLTDRGTKLTVRTAFARTGKILNFG